MHTTDLNNDGLITFREYLDANYKIKYLITDYKDLKIN